jgi:hypothetical protein
LLQPHCREMSANTTKALMLILPIILKVKPIYNS